MSRWSTIVHLFVPVDGAWFGGAYFQYGYDVVPVSAVFDFSIYHGARGDKRALFRHVQQTFPRCEVRIIGRCKAMATGILGSNPLQTRPVGFLAPLALVDRSHHDVDSSAAAWSAYRAGGSRREQEPPALAFIASSQLLVYHPQKPLPELSPVDRTGPGRRFTQLCGRIYTTNHRMRPKRVKHSTAVWRCTITLLRRLQSRHDQASIPAVSRHNR